MDVVFGDTGRGPGEAEGERGEAEGAGVPCPGMGDREPDGSVEVRAGGRGSRVGEPYGII